MFKFIQKIQIFILALSYRTVRLFTTAAVA